MTTPTFQHLDCRVDGGVLVVTLLDTHISGDDLAEAMRRELLAAAEAFPDCAWVIDFRRVTFFTSAGIRPLLTLLRKLQSAAGRLVLCNMKEAVAEVFHATRLLATPGSPPGPFEAAVDLEQALRRIRRHTSRVVDGILVLTITERDLRGEEVAGDLGREFLLSWEQARTPHVVVDFQNVVMVTTPCIRSLLHLRSRLKEHNVDIALCNLAPQIAEVFTVTRLISPDANAPSLFAAHEDIASALGAASRQEASISDSGQAS